MRPIDQTLSAVAAAALAWNRARLVRIDTAKRLHELQHPLRHLDLARKAEAQALAALRKACAKADPKPITVDAKPLPVKAHSLVVDVQAKEVPTC